MSKNMAVLDENNNVINLVVCEDDQPETATQITYTDANPAWIGGDYVDGYFYTPQPYPSWTRDNGIWVAPIPMPDDGLPYIWNEETQSWDLDEPSSL
jgi:hypothetical protein